MLMSEPRPTVTNPPTLPALTLSPSPASILFNTLPRPTLATPMPHPMTSAPILPPATIATPMIKEEIETGTSSSSSTPSPSPSWFNNTPESKASVTRLLPGPKPALSASKDEQNLTEQQYLILKTRRENHRAVERRRRDSINIGIEALAKVVPGCQKSKGKILQKTHDYIRQLQGTNARQALALEKLKAKTDAKINLLRTAVRQLVEENATLRGKSKTVAEVEGVLADLMDNDDDTVTLSDDEKDLEAANILIHAADLQKRMTPN